MTINLNDNTKKKNGIINLKDLSKEQILNTIGKAKDFLFEHSILEKNVKLKNKRLLLITDNTTQIVDLAYKVAVKEMGGEIFDFTLTSEFRSNLHENSILLNTFKTYDFFAIIVNTKNRDDLTLFSPLSIPIINACDQINPAVSIAAMLTIQDKFTFFSKLNILYVSDNLSNDSLFYSLSKMNANLLVVCNDSDLDNDAINYCSQFTTINKLDSEKIQDNIDLLISSSDSLLLSKVSISEIESISSCLLLNINAKDKLTEYTESHSDTTLSLFKNYLFGIKATISLLL